MGRKRNRKKESEEQKVGKKQTYEAQTFVQQFTQWSTLPLNHLNKGGMDGVVSDFDL